MTRLYIILTIVVIAGLYTLISKPSVETYRDSYKSDLASQGSPSVEGYSKQILRIRKALKKYHQESGKYPSELSELTPKYLSELPSLMDGERKWKYATDGENFQLS